MHPYRAHTSSRRERQGVRALARARRATLLSVIPLAVLSVAFFLPVERGMSPVVLLRDGDDAHWLIALAFIWPPYCVAALLATILAVAAGRSWLRRPGGKSLRGPIPGADSRWIATRAVCGCFLSAPALGALIILSPNTTPAVAAYLWFSVVLAALFGALFLTRMRRARGWRRWSFLLAAYAASTCPVTALHVFIVAENQRAAPGIVAYGLGVVALWALSFTAIWPARRGEVAGDPRGP
jgi:hypothetical protein